MTSLNAQTPRWKKLLLPLGVGAVAGFLASFGFLQLTDFAGDSPLGTSREIAGLVGILYFLTGLAVLFGVLRPGAGARILNVEDADELREQRVQLTYSACAVLALGAALATLALAGDGLWIAATTGALLAGILIVLASALSVAMNRHTDELQRALSKDAVGAAFNLLFFIGGGWALLAHTGFLEAPAPLDWLTMFSVAMLLGGFWQVARRGLLFRGPN